MESLSFRWPCIQSRYCNMILFTHRSESTHLNTSKIRNGHTMGCVSKEYNVTVHATCDSEHFKAATRQKVQEQPETWEFPGKSVSLGNMINIASNKAWSLFSHLLGPCQQYGQNEFLFCEIPLSLISC